MADGKNTNILHLSDLHFGMEPSEKIPSTAVDQRNLTLDGLVKTLKHLDDKWRPRVVAISGDIAWKSKPEDYEKAGEWITGKLLPALDLKSENIVICPGNHDLDRKKTIGMPPPPDNETADDWLKREHIENFARPFASYVSFCKNLGIPKPEIGEQTDYLTGTVEMGDIRFVILNSAWFCRDDNDRNNLWLGKPLLEKMAANGQLFDENGHDGKTSPVTVVLFHHPPEWLNEWESNTYSDRQNTLERLCLRSHIILNGHVHARPAEPTRHFNRAWQVRGGASYAENAYKNHFSILRIDTGNRYFERMAWEFDPGKNKWRKDTEDPLSYDLKISGKTEGRSHSDPSPQHVAKTIAVDPEKLRHAYLNRVFWEAGVLPLKGIDPKAASDVEASQMNLGAVYTALMTIHSRHEDRRAELLEKMARGDMSAGESGDHERISALEMLNTHQHLVLLGDPGSGKSTFVNFVAWCLAGEALGDRDANLKSLTQPLPSEKNGEKDAEKPQSWDHGPVLPVRVILRDFAAKTLDTNEKPARFADLWDFIADELRTATMGEYAPHLQKELKEKGGLLLLDGLDEVPEARDRRTRIKEVVEDFRMSYPLCRVLVTSRTYAYQKQDWRISGMTETALSPFGPGQIRRFVDRWYDYVAALERKADKDDTRGRAETLKRAIFNNRRLQELAERPLLLTLMASLHAWRGGSLPEKREELYADTLDLLLDWWEGYKIIRNQKGERIRERSLSEWLNTDRDQVRDLLSREAFEAHSKQKDLKGTADVPEDRLISGLMKLSDNPNVRPKQLVNYLSNRAGLLVPRGVGVYTFPHRTFQEYLAACYLTDNDYPEMVAGLARKDPGRWREAALLAAAKAVRGSASSIWLFADAMCHKNTDDPEATSEDVWGALIAGRALAESANLKNVSAVNRKKLDRVRQWLVRILSGHELPAAERVLAGNILAQLGDPRFDPKRWHLPDDDELGFVGIPADKFLMGSDEQTDKLAYDDEMPQHEVELAAYRIAKYPVTKAQYRAFVTDSGYDKTDKRWETHGEDNHPVVWVTWQDARAYCDWLTGKLRDRGWKISLPTEAQWEMAARGADGRMYPYGNEPDKEKMNYAETGIGATSPVGCFPDGRSPFDIFDMAGNVWEWCEDDWHDNYQDAPTDGSAWVDEPRGSNLVARGGRWGFDAQGCRSACRYDYAPSDHYDGLGFRLSRSA